VRDAPDGSAGRRTTRLHSGGRHADDQRPRAVGCVRSAEHGRPRWTCPRRGERLARRVCLRPGVTVDQEGRVSLRGSDKVAILIDGRQSSLTAFGTQRGLDSVSAANIEAIEIINNPSALFDAAGMAGIINIIYKKEQQLGWSGDVGFGLGMGQFTK
jgi:hypothetical protein